VPYLLYHHQEIRIEKKEVYSTLSLSASTVYNVCRQGACVKKSFLSIHLAILVPREIKSANLRACMYIMLLPDDHFACVVTDSFAPVLNVATAQM
jgi:hypothetical protein